MRISDWSSDVCSSDLEAFVFELVEHVGHVDRLIPREQHYIDTRQPEYNTCRIAGSRKGTKQSDTAKAKISRAHKSVWNTSQRRAKHDEILRKRWDSTDQREIGRAAGRERECKYV